MILLETILRSFTDLAVLLFAYICIGILVFSGIQGMLKYIRKDSDTRLVLGKGLAAALEFLLGSFILRILTDPTWISALTALIILIMLTILSILIHLAEKHTLPVDMNDTSAKPEPEES